MMIRRVLSACLVAALAGACGGGGGGGGGGDGAPLTGTVNHATWTFAGGIYFADDEASPPSFRLDLTLELSPACRTSGGGSNTGGSGDATVELVLPQDPTQLAATTSTTAVADYDDAAGTMQNMAADLSDLALGSDGLISGALTASDSAGDSLDGAFTAHACD
jgi:hypothetical protein